MYTETMYWKIRDAFINFILVSYTPQPIYSRRKGLVKMITLMRQVGMPNLVSIRDMPIFFVCMVWVYTQKYELQIHAYAYV